MHKEGLYIVNAPLGPFDVCPELLTAALVCALPGIFLFMFERLIAKMRKVPLSLSLNSNPYVEMLEFCVS